MKYILIIFCLLGSLLQPLSVNAAPKIQADAVILMDFKTGQVLWEKNMRRQLAPASTTKIITAIVALERGQLDTEITVSAKAAGTPGSTMHLYTGQKLSLKELLTGLMLRSGNDAAVAIAEHIAGSTTEFARLMNEKAAQIGAQNSNFVNPHGLSAVGHYSSAYDLALIARYALQHPTFAELVRTREDSVDWFDGKGQEQEKVLRNTNRLLWMLADADGIKTGTTGQAGPCLVASATRNGQKLISVVLHDHKRWSDSMELLQYGFKNFTLISYADVDSSLAAIPVENGLLNNISVRPATAAAIVVKTSEAAATTMEINLPETVKAPIFRGQKIGEIVFYIENQAVKVIDVIADRDVEEKTFSRIVMNKLTGMYRRLSNWGVL